MPSDLEQIVAALVLGALIALGALYVRNHWHDLFSNAPPHYDKATGDIR